MVVPTIAFSPDARATPRGVRTVTTRRTGATRPYPEVTWELAVARHIPILEAIGRRIADRDLPPGTVFTLASIGEEYGVSRTVAREVMHQLETMGLITSSPRVGLVVQPQRSWSLFDPRLIRWRLEGADRAEQLRSLTGLREAIEPAAAGEAARRATPEQGVRFVELAEEMLAFVATGEVEGFLDLDVEFHRRLVELSGNEMFTALGPVVEAVLRWRTELAHLSAVPSSDALRAHVAIARAVAAGDDRGARRAMEDMITDVHSQFEALLV